MDKSDRRGPHAGRPHADGEESYPIDENPIKAADAVHQREAEEKYNSEQMKGLRAKNHRRKDSLF